MHQGNVDAFIAAVKDKAYELEKSKSYKHWQSELKHWRDKYEKVKETRKGADKDKNNLEKEWADCIKAWYQARYAHYLFLHLHTRDANYMPVFIHDRAEVEMLPDAQLQSEACRHTQAAHELAATDGAELNKFRTDALKYDKVASDVHVSKTWEKTFGDAKKKFEGAAAGTFEDKDVKSYKD